MTKVGILVHCRHLETENWEDLVFGMPGEDKLGDHATLIRTMLSMEPTEELSCIVFGRGPSWRNGLNEAEYAKKYLIDNLDRLREFTSLRPLLKQQTPTDFENLRHTLEQSIVITEEVKNTVAELTAASRIFTEHGVERVIQIAAASHAPRCLKEQTVARSHGKISRTQQWFTVATDMTYHGTTPEDVCVLEPMHRKDQPMTYVRPGMSEVMASYFLLPDDDKKQLITLVKNFMDARK